MDSSQSSSDTQSAVSYTHLYQLAGRPWEVYRPSAGKRMAGVLWTV